MRQRNMLYKGPIPETEHGYIHPERCVVPYGIILSYLQPTNSNSSTIVPSSGNQTRFNPQHLPENGPFTQFNGLDHHPPHPANNVFMTPTGALVLPSAMNLGSFENGQFIDVFKRKNAEGLFTGNIQYFYPTHGSNSNIAIPMNTKGTTIDGPSLVMEPVVHRSGRNSGAIGVEPDLAHSISNFTPGNYGGQPLQAVPNPWLDQQFCGNGSDGIAFSWNYNIPGTFVHLPAIMTHHNIHHPPPPSMPPMQGPKIDFHSQVASSHRLPTNTNINPFQNGTEPPMPRFVGPSRFFQHNRRGLMVEATVRHRVFPHLRVLPEDGVAILDISGYHEAGVSVDHHRDMRLDIDHMSYEELVALGEQIGSAGSGLSNDFILEHLKTRVFASSKTSSESQPEDTSSADQQLNCCVICQTNYDDQEQIGVIDCGHEYHIECMKKWLTVKNTCPVCKSTALAAKAL